MILPCGCDSIYMGFFDRCGPCKERLATEAEILNKREKEHGPVGHTYGYEYHGHYIIEGSQYGPILK